MAAALMEYSTNNPPRNTRNADADHVPMPPQLLRANATCHKWAFGAIAELVDRAVAEIDDGATVVHLEPIVNPRNREPALLVADDGKGMTPYGLRQSIGFPSIKATCCYEDSVLGHFQRGLKATTMRLGADAVVFTVCPYSSTASVGLLSYTFLFENRHGDTVVPVLNYNCINEPSNSTSRRLTLQRMQNESNEKHWNNLLRTILKWSPFSTEQELLDMFDRIGDHGTCIIVYNLWRNKDQGTELDFESVEDDIQIRRALADEPKRKTLAHFLHQQHIAERFRYSLRAYLSILYLRWPGNNFSIILRGRPVEHYDLALDMKCIKSQVCNLPKVVDGTKDKLSVTGKVGFVKEAPLVNIRGFNLYYKNRLIVPFWRSAITSEAKGVVGFVEFDCLTPSPGEEEFQRSPILSYLEGSLIKLSNDFWTRYSYLVTDRLNNELPNL